MKNLFLFTFVILLAGNTKAQTLNCASFCVSGMTLDTANDELNVTIINSGTQDVNYPTVVVTNSTADTVGNINNLFYLFQHPAGDTITHTIPTTLTNLPSGFTGTVYFTDQILDETCAMSYPMNCAVGISEYISASLNIYPNPAVDKIVIENLNENSLITVYDSLGKLLRKHNSSSSQFIISRGEMKSGFYFITIINENKIHTQKVIFE